MCSEVYMRTGLVDEYGYLPTNLPVAWLPRWRVSLLGGGLAVTAGARIEGKDGEVERGGGSVTLSG